jgi:murein DD-endopeptidase MepM/ murein hydrolase activator NlpD
MNHAWIRWSGLALICALGACASTREHESFSPSFATAGPVLWPVDLSAHVITSGYGVQRGRRVFHRGVDIAAPRGATVIATAPGVATLAHDGGGYGHYIVIDHGNGYSTLYAHLLETRVRDGDRVAAGQTIGRVGKSGNATGYHLHYEVHRGGATVDPRLYLPGSTSSLAKTR